jgi:uncharacterized membrane protein YgdD (TMEM256/DUF423 family)
MRYGARMQRRFAIPAALFGFLSVAAGAFGSHALRGRISAEMLGAFETAARYQMYHALALLVLARAAKRATSRAIPLAAYLMVAGTIVFSGSLYALTLSGIRWYGAITPIGGALFLASWLVLAWGALLGKGEGMTWP